MERLIGVCSFFCSCFQKSGLGRGIELDLGKSRENHGAQKLLIRRPSSTTVSANALIFGCIAQKKKNEETCDVQNLTELSLCRNSRNTNLAFSYPDHWRRSRRSTTSKWWGRWRSTGQAFRLTRPWRSTTRWWSTCITRYGHLAYGNFKGVNSRGPPLPQPPMILPLYPLPLPPCV